MSSQIDLPLFNRTTGEIDILAAVSIPFLTQLVPWRQAMHQHTETFNVSQLTNLVHKMKGSCYVVAAMNVAAEFEQAENGLTQMTQADWHPVYQRLLALTQELEVELISIISRHGQG
ncbi:hypothetical protein [Rhodoferax sp. PAMC 29310]|uniref:hypothetical protein n=1 Tax=Rhodoferax sp. PAMC 29310 TaxID=2822760 RepID=UPI001B334CAB|nr:hypothetical protein [Rhodoferax sp. PAMC 29310]